MDSKDILQALKAIKRLVYEHDRITLELEMIRRFRGKSVPLKAIYPKRGGIVYRATLLYNGRQVSYRGEVYSSPSAAGKAVTGQTASSGWDFWQVEIGPGRWEPLDKIRKYLVKPGKT